jgi:hypothetical protein
VSDLTDKEQKAVRTALRFLRLRMGAWAPLAKALRYEYDSVQKVAAGKKAVTPALALRVARLVDVGMDELLAGQWISPRTCPHCGRPPEDFVDEETVITDEAPADERAHSSIGNLRFTAQR